MGIWILAFGILRNARFPKLSVVAKVNYIVSGFGQTHLFCPVIGALLKSGHASFKSLGFLTAQPWRDDRLWLLRDVRPILRAWRNNHWV